MQARKPAVLVLEDGREFPGEVFGAAGKTVGELVFATGMTGYQETLTDPSYAAQIVVMTAPHVGNTGVNLEDNESQRIWVSGFVVRDPALRPSNFRATGTLDDALLQSQVVGISGVDTREITRHIRSAGTMRAGIFSGEHAELDPEERLLEVRHAAPMAGLNLSARVSTRETYRRAPTAPRVGSVAVLDLGVKSATLSSLAEVGFEVVIMPESSTLAEIERQDPDALFYSNGPGDPGASTRHVQLLQDWLRSGRPYFGICFGNQLLGRALGLDTYKLPFGHRGLNQPVLDVETGRVEITAHNHGFAVAAPIGETLESSAGFGRFVVSHYDLNDRVVEGLRCLDLPASSVQYHPEAAAGPHDAHYLFQRFRQTVATFSDRS